MSINNFIGIGNLSKPPTLKETPSGVLVSNFSIAIDRKFYHTDQTTGQKTKQSECDWLPIVAWGKLAKSCNSHLQSGSKVCVKGSVRPRTYVDRQNVHHNTFEIIASEVIFLDKIKRST